MYELTTGYMFVLTVSANGYWTPDKTMSTIWIRTMVECVFSYFRNTRKGAHANKEKQSYAQLIDAFAIHLMHFTCKYLNTYVSKAVSRASQKLLYMYVL